MKLLYYFFSSSCSARHKRTGDGDRFKGNEELTKNFVYKYLVCILIKVRQTLCGKCPTILCKEEGRKIICLEY